ncbi:fumarylacetoacetate hydrolase family protein [Aminobacter sp. NyZ550]|uniref:2-keto-4-pentenoate hydratase/2-oxohepta-3-ene-1,7-dioic acid hydratase in catechol pathway n=1 Tax=Aminobacter ciceronei TaxID=150723 RepID=A0ABR6CF07_9HYPH|nr:MULTISPECIES: fumarylacetoacetate hydrolase family protein [Aminobacter]MBA8909814.1 2-keto-4-pentenoate hydratase/2-oxohepta-3-ene-1,7-dioic acid hydratase in catechol pathway [Aminobacter ciceronei]MBA9023590.1 2-keto-4-pentenoate hydratase/2-oxohepta-3-ene-1,7-dioic acid hydratase in catechol pathway [Aminobacter ciceronei]WAX96276.1 fumarylacetoacetate hydrolase family protein [Aminobacter sp. NyZ550]WMC96688.1 fumarylacetoacetate hydrolase family protein [Aminobacter aminovorans]
MIRDEVRPVLVTEQGVYDLALVARLTGKDAQAWDKWISAGVAGMLDRWLDVAPALAALAENVAAAGPKYEPLGTGTQLCEPYRPIRIFATASNYVEHAQEMGTVLAAKSESQPYVFMKADSSVIGPDAAVILPERAQKVDWEVELAAVIGIGGRDIPVEKALEHVAAYSVINDITSRDLTRRSDFPFKFDWFRGKSFDTFAPLGPWLVPAACIGDPQSLRLTLDVNGTRKQDDSTGSMIFSVAEQISYLSSILTLRPGDLIATGTPDGVGMGTGEFLNCGDIVTAAVEKVGAITNPIRSMPVG